MIREEGTVKRCDLRFRITYFGVHTELYEIEPYQYVIFVSNYPGNHDAISKKFDYSIRPVGCNISLVFQCPNQYIKKIENIRFENIVDDFNAMCDIKADLDNFLKLKFIDVEIINIKTPKKGSDFEILIEVSEKTTDEQINNMRLELNKTDLGTDKISVQRTDKKEAEKTELKSGVVGPPFLRADENLPFTINEGVFWYDNAKKIYSGDLPRKDLMFFDSNATKCYFDFSVFDNVNIRNALLLYDKVFITPPLYEYADSFYSKQGMTQNDLIELAERGKVTLLLTNDEKQYDGKLLTEVYKNAPLSIVGRRGINTLLASYLAETSKQYEQLHPNIYNVASNLFLEGYKTEDRKILQFAKFIAWPKLALLQSFDVFNSFSPIAMAKIGINNIITDFWELGEKKEELEFEFLVHSLNTHLSSALQATYFPFQQIDKNGRVYSDGAFAKIMGDRLSFYAYDADSLSNIKKIRTQNANCYLDMYAFREHISVLKVTDIADDYKTHIYFRNLLLRLDEMSEEEKTKTVREYNDILYDLAGENKKEKKKNVMKFFLGVLDFLPLPNCITLPLALRGMVMDLFEDTKVKCDLDSYLNIERKMKEYGIEVEQQKVEDIILLDKISRVATLK